MPEEYPKGVHETLVIDIAALETKVDAIQADMDIIKPWIEALYEDLNP